MTLGAIFGQSWTQRHFSEDQWNIAKSEWSNSLAKYADNPKIIQKALDLLKSNARNYPPNLTEFLQLCRKCEPLKQSDGFHEASEDFKKRYYEWDHKPMCFKEKNTNGTKDNGSRFGNNNL